MIQVRSLEGLRSYQEIRELQLSLIDQRAQDQIPDTLLFLEHSPVITQGRGLQFTGVSNTLRHMPRPQNLPKGIEFSESERGGDLTYHGPGQLVMYPLFKLDGNGFAPNRDVAEFLRKLERVVLNVLARMGLSAHVRPHATGVWIGDQKIASIGIAIRKWVSYHGIALNCVNDLTPFQLISPCGFSPDVMTRLADWMPMDSLTWRSELEELVPKEFEKAEFEMAEFELIDFKGKNRLEHIRD